MPVPKFTKAPVAFTKVIKGEATEEDLGFYGYRLTEDQNLSIMEATHEVFRSIAVLFELRFVANPREDISSISGIMATLSAKLGSTDLGQIMYSLITADEDLLDSLGSGAYSDIIDSDLHNLQTAVDAALEKGERDPLMASILNIAKEKLPSVLSAAETMLAIEGFGEEVCYNVHTQTIECSSDDYDYSSTTYKDYDYELGFAASLADTVDGLDSVCKYLVTYALLLVRSHNKIVLEMFKDLLSGDSLKHVSHPPQPLSPEQPEKLKYHNKAEWRNIKGLTYVASNPKSLIWFNAGISKYARQYKYLVSAWCQLRSSMREKREENENEDKANKKEVFDIIQEVLKEIESIPDEVDPCISVMETELLRDVQE